MPNRLMAPVLRLLACLLASALAASSVGTGSSQTLDSEQILWNLEHAFWLQAQNNNVPAYLNLWHKDGLGWPLVSDIPVRKDHSADWFTAQASKGLVLERFDIKPAGVQISGDVAVTCYWVAYKWATRNGAGGTRTARVIHTWVKNGKDWRIISGMSMLEPENSGK